jgi:ribosomal protein S6
MSTTVDHASFENTQDKERTVYEIGYLVLPSIPEDSLDSVVSKITNAFENEGGARIDGEAPFLNPLSYEMSKQVGARKYVVREAYLGWVKFDLEPSKIETVKATLEKIEEILRFLIVKVPRETTFTFAEARAKKAALEAPAEEVSDEAEKPVEAVEATESEEATSTGDAVVE